MKILSLVLGLILLSLSSSFAYAHAGHSLLHSSFTAGFFHPFSGWDHIITMLAIGAWAFRQNKMWKMPLAFMLALWIGAIAAPILPVFDIESFVMLTTTLVIVATFRPIPRLLGWGFLLAAGFFHGIAHGLEIPGDMAFNSFGLGFLAATASLHLMGIAGGSLYKRYSQRSWISNQV